MEVKVERTSHIAWNILEGIIPPEYLAYVKKDCINEKRITLYTAGESGKTASGYLFLAPVHCRSKMYELVHMQVMLEDTQKHIGSNLIDSVVEDLKRNKVKQLCLSYDDEDDEEGFLEAFFSEKGFKKEGSYSIQCYNVQQLLDSMVHKRSYEIPVNNLFKSYDELSKTNRVELINEKKIAVNAANQKYLHFLVVNGEIVAMNGIYHMKDRIVLDDILIFDHSRIRETVILIWSYFVEYVCSTYEKKNYKAVEIVTPNANYEEAALRLIGEPVSKTSKQKMIMDLNVQ